MGGWGGGGGVGGRGGRGETRSPVLHRDIRPGNVMVSQVGIVKIIDLGFGKEVKEFAGGGRGGGG